MTEATASTPSATTQTQQINMGRLWWAGLLAAVVATIGNILVRMATVALFPIPETFPPFALQRIALFSVVGVVGATGVLALLARFTQRPVRWFWIVSLVVLVLSFIPNILLLITRNLPGTNVPGVLSLMLMHVVAAAAAVGILIGAARQP